MGPLITAWAALSPFGSAPDDLAAGLRAGPPAGGDVPGFDVRTALGPKGTRNLDRLTGLAVATTGLLLDGRAGIGEDTAVVLGTDSGSVASMMDFTRASMTNERPYFVEAARFPNVTMNCAAAQIAIRHRLRGPNTTVAGGRVAGLLALRYAGRLQRAGRADVVLCGAVEESSSARTLLAQRTEVAGPLAEGCAMLLLESAGHARAHGRTALASVAAMAFGVVAEDGDVREALGALLRRALAQAGVQPGDVGVAVTSGGPAAERDAVVDTVGAPLLLDSTELLGDTGPVSCVFGIVAALELSGPGRQVLVQTAVDRDGGLGCAVLRR